MSKLHPIFEQAMAPFLKPIATRNGPCCSSECDCDATSNAGGTDHAADCHSRQHCDEGRSCDRHAAEAEAEHAWMRNVSQGAATGVMSEQDKQDLRDAGRGHLVR